MKKIIFKILLSALLLMGLLCLGSCSSDEGDCQHVWGEWTVQKEPNCYEGGYSTRICTLCQMEDRRVMNAKGHSFSEEWSNLNGQYHYHAATCEHTDQRSGLEQHDFAENNICTVCGVQWVSQNLFYRQISESGGWYVSGIGRCGDVEIVIGRTIDGNAITGVANYAFRNCEIDSVTMQENILAIGDGAFSGSSVQWVRFTKAVTYIGESVFDGCEDIVAVYFEGTEEDWNSIRKSAAWRDGAPEFDVIYQSGESEIIINTDCEHLFGEWTVAKEGPCYEGGYYERICSLCSSFEVSESHEFSESWSYNSTHHWHEATCNHTSMVSGYSTHTFNSDNVCTVCEISRVSQGLSYKGVLGTSNYLVSGIGTCLDQNVVVGKNYNSVDYFIVGVADGGFADCDGLISVFLRENILTIGDGAFANSKDLTKVQFTSSLEYLGSAAFSGCTSLERVEFIGTLAEWEALDKADDWADGARGFMVVCLDGYLEF